MMNKRVKGSEKFWSEPGAEAILQLRADYLGENRDHEPILARTRGPSQQPSPLPTRRLNIRHFKPRRAPP